MKVEITNLDDLFAAFIDYLEKVEDKALNPGDIKPKDLSEIFRPVMEEDLKKRFDSSPQTKSGGVVYGGAKWKKLSDWYLSLRPDRRSGFIYIDTKNLQDSLIKQNNKQISRIVDNSYEFGTTVDYAEKLQKMRPFVFMHQELLDKLAETYLEWLVEVDSET